MLHSACVGAVQCSAWIVRAVVYLACVCVCVRPSAWAARLVPFVQRFVCQRGQMCLVCPTPCAVCLGSTAMYLLARVGTRAGTPLYSASLGQSGQCIYLPVLVLVLVPLVQCFAWSARAMNLFARVHTCAVCESLHSVYCACIPCFAWSARVMYLLARVRTRTGTSCAVLRLNSTGNVPTCPWSYSYWGPHG